MEEEEEEEEVAAEAGRRSLASKQQPEFPETTPELGDPLTQTTPEDEVSASEGGKAMKQRGATAVVEREKGVTGDHKKSHKAERKKSSKKSKSPRRTASIEPM